MDWQAFESAAQPAPPPFLDHCVAALRALGAFVGDRTLRRYQDVLLERGNFSVPSPFTGEATRVRTCHVQPTSDILYVFEGAPRFGVLAERANFGFAFTTVVTVNGWTMLGTSVKPVRPLRRLLRSPGGKRWQARARPLAIVGHRNFAHGFWNEFPALDLVRSRGRSFDLAPVFDPLLLFGRYADHHGLDRLSVASLQQLHGWTDRPVTHLGAVYCDDTAKSAVLSTLFGDDPPRPSEVPTVYFSVRDAGRTMVNQAEFIVETCRRLVRTVRRLRILVDGFSVASDMAEPVYDATRDRIAAKVRRTRAITDDIVRSLRALPEAPDVIDLTGLSLTEALPWIGQSHFYVTHAGTSHHKIGWLFPVAGVLHSNAAKLSPQLLSLHGEAVAGSKPPVVLPPALVETLDTTDRPVKLPKAFDYRVTDIDASAEFVAREFAAVMAASSPETT